VGEKEGCDGKVADEKTPFQYHADPLLIGKLPYTCDEAFPPLRVHLMIPYSKC
jgi:hypothetical protein